MNSKFKFLLLSSLLFAGSVKANGSCPSFSPSFQPKIYKEIVIRDGLTLEDIQIMLQNIKKETVIKQDAYLYSYALNLCCIEEKTQDNTGAYIIIRRAITLKDVCERLQMTPEQVKARMSALELEIPEDLI